LTRRPPAGTTAIAVTTEPHDMATPPKIAEEDEPELDLKKILRNTLVAVLVIMIGKRSRDVKKGLPVHDEMTQRLKERAGYIAYSITLYFMLALLWVDFLVEDMEAFGLEPRFIVYGTLFFMLAVFSISWLMLKRRGV